jgi:hypothetical protein
MITVDWSVGSDTINYVTARNRVGNAGLIVGQFADFLHQNGVLRFEDTHFIGHSLGQVIFNIIFKSIYNWNYTIGDKLLD